MFMWLSSFYQRESVWRDEALRQKQQIYKLTTENQALTEENEQLRGQLREVVSAATRPVPKTFSSHRNETLDKAIKELDNNKGQILRVHSLTGKANNPEETRRKAMDWLRAQGH